MPIAGTSVSAAFVGAVRSDSPGGRPHSTLTRRAERNGDHGAGPKELARGSPLPRIFCVKVGWDLFADFRTAQGDRFQDIP